MAGAGAHVHGFVLVDKPAGPSSFACVGAVRRALGVRKAGHGGTLDPFATGLSIVLVGRATRLMPWVVGHDKRYEVGVQLGVRSSTDDATGELSHSAGPLPPVDAVRDAITQLAARREQVPPAVSAIHVGGERAYRRVRRGEQLDLPPRPVTFHRIELLDYDQASGFVQLDVECSTGTYMRSLARDLGDLLGCGGLAATLRRTAVGPWSVDDAVDVGAVGLQAVRPMRELVQGLRSVPLDEVQLQAFSMGQQVPVSASGADDAVACLDPAGELVGIAALRDGGARLRPRVVLVDQLAPAGGARD